VITGTITPHQNYKYLEIVTTWYDAQGNVIPCEIIPIAWNVNDPKANQPIRFSTIPAFMNTTVKPVKVDLKVCNYPFSNGDERFTIYETTLNL